jgi:hypothetical protein
MIWFPCSALVILTGLYVLMPLFQKSRERLDLNLGETELDRLQDRKTIIYKSIKELEFEYKMGRLSDADFKQLDAGYKNGAAIILQEMEKLGVAEESDTLIEKEIAAHKKKLERGSTKCPSCGAETASEKKFCADCGHQLKK